MSDKEKSLYPNPKDYKGYEELTLAYTFARGATELLKSTIENLKQREDVIKSLKEKEKGERKLWGRI